MITGNEADRIRQTYAADSIERASKTKQSRKATA
jgi:hypothetical protein